MAGRRVKQGERRVKTKSTFSNTQGEKRLLPVFSKKKRKSVGFKTQQ